MIKKIISGGQTGADIAALRSAQLFNIETGGWMTKGWKTLNGPRPEYARLYNMEEIETYSYKDRTWANVRDSDGTLRIARDFNSPGEKCTLNAIRAAQKPYFDVDLKLVSVDYYEKIVNWLVNNNIETLNVAGNTEKTAPGIESVVFGMMGIILSMDKLRCTK